MSQFDYGSIAPKIFGLTAGANVVIDPTQGVIFTLSPNEAESITALTPGFPGQQFTLQINTINTTTRTLTFSTGLRSTGTLATGGSSGVRFNIRFESDGLVWSEIGRTAAQA